MRGRIIIWLVVLFVITGAPACCFHRAHRPTHAVVDVPDIPVYNSYIHLERKYYVPMGDERILFASQSAGAVCVSADNEGCYVLTVNHFCEVETGGTASLSSLETELNATNIFAAKSDSVEIIDVMPEADLCLLRVEGDFPYQVKAFQNPLETERFVELDNYGAPAGYFNSEDFRWIMSMYEGRWGGFCSSICSLPDDRIRLRFFILHTIPTTSGQSGSPIFVGDRLFALQVASNRAIDDFGIGVHAIAMYEILKRNDIEVSFE